MSEQNDFSGDEHHHVCDMSIPEEGSLNCICDQIAEEASRTIGDTKLNTITFNEGGHRVHGTATIRQLTMRAADVHLEHLDDNVYMLIVENAERYVYVKLTARSNRGKIDGWIYEESEQEFPERFQQSPALGQRNG